MCIRDSQYSLMKGEKQDKNRNNNSLGIASSKQSKIQSRRNSFQKPQKQEDIKIVLNDSKESNKSKFSIDKEKNKEKSPSNLEKSQFAQIFERNTYKNKEISPQEGAN
eukprot:TRINITY_DN3505_c0_g1_i6.p1 TRINITY_DN3505_c0_g1~~TRINITY_DN3505_c0_g1_i6.p1  ORF type:complete len:108 (+),score=15.72 TRINITY_DN3505_c0_g1_i6:178-501(+)